MSTFDAFIHMDDDRLVDCFASYFGSFTCVAFSDDSRFVLVGPAT